MSVQTTSAATNFDNIVGAGSEELAKEALSRMDVHLDLIMTMIRPLDGLQQVEYLKEFQDIYKRLEKGLEPVLVNQEPWKLDKTYLWHDYRIVVPSDGIPALLNWGHESSGHVGADCTLKLFKKWLHSTWSDCQLRKTLRPLADKCPCRSCKSGDIRDRGLYSTLPTPHCANRVINVAYTGMPKFGGYDFALVVTCRLTRFTRVFPCTKHITGEETIKILLEEPFCVYEAPKEISIPTRMSEYAQTLAGTTDSRGPSMSKCLRGILMLIRVTPYVSDKSQFSRRKSDNGARLSAPKAG